MIKLSFNAAARVINFHKDGRWFYDIGLDRFSDSKSSLEMIRHLTEKSWITPDILAQICVYVIEGSNARCA